MKKSYNHFVNHYDPILDLEKQVTCICRKLISLERFINNKTNLYPQYVVDQGGKGQFETIGDAINAAISDGVAGASIVVFPGSYMLPTEIPHFENGLQLIGLNGSETADAIELHGDTTTEGNVHVTSVKFSGGKWENKGRTDKQKKDNFDRFDSVKIESGQLFCTIDRGRLGVRNSRIDVEKTADSLFDSTFQCDIDKADQALENISDDSIENVLNIQYCDIRTCIDNSVNTDQNLIKVNVSNSGPNQPDISIKTNDMFIENRSSKRLCLVAVDHTTNNNDEADTNVGVDEASNNGIFRSLGGNIDFVGAFNGGTPRNLQAIVRSRGSSLTSTGTPTVTHTCNLINPQGQLFSGTNVKDFKNLNSNLPTTTAGIRNRVEISGCIIETDKQVSLMPGNVSGADNTQQIQIKTTFSSLSTGDLSAEALAEKGVLVAGGNTSAGSSLVQALSADIRESSGTVTWARTNNLAGSQARHGNGTGNTAPAVANSVVVESSLS